MQPRISRNAIAMIISLCILALLFILLLVKNMNHDTTTGAKPVSATGGLDDMEQIKPYHKIPDSHILLDGQNLEEHEERFKDGRSQEVR